VNNKYNISKAKQGYYESTPRPSQEELDIFYNDLYYGEGVTDTYSENYTDSEIKQKQLRADCTVELLSQNTKLSHDSISALEIGSGEGFVIQSCLSKGWNVVGVDYQSSPVQKNNPGALENFIESDPNDFLIKAIEKGDKYDVVILQNVLEHVIDPEKLMKQLIDVLDENGLILVQVPNDFSDLQKLAKEQGLIDRDYWVCPPQHLNYFNDENFGPFIAGIGGVVVDAITDFPIEMYLWGNKSNYVCDKSIGKLSHMARVNLDIKISQRGLENYVDFYRSVYKVGLGRNIIAVIKKA
jgi:SAM-dependent methyltransferase